MNIPCSFCLMFTIVLLPCPSSPNIILIFQPAAHGTDISTGNQPGIPSLPPAATPDAGNTNSPSPGDRPATYCQDNYSNIFPSYPGLVVAGGPDRNHNTQLPSPCGGECARPGCRNLVTKASDGTESPYCSSECVVGQCR